MSINVKKLIKDAIEAIDDEIRAVTLRPSRDSLLLDDLTRKKKKAYDENTYAFKTQNQSFQHVDELKVVSCTPEIKGEVDSFDDDQVIISFEKPLEEPVIAIEVEWINDYILRRTKDQLEFLLKPDSATYLDRVKHILNPKEKPVHTEDIHQDGLRNKAQIDAIHKSLTNRVTYVWGPPGTGKTATLGFIIANYLMKGKKVLFASNTNRAVDVGLLSVLAALQDINHNPEPDIMTRFGDIALNHERITQLHFDAQIESKQEEIKLAMQPERDDVRRQMLLDITNKLTKAGKEIPSKISYELELLGSDKEDAEAKKLALSEELEMLTFREIRKKQLIATTLARLCTSDLLHTLSFDAVVIDEASMAGLPYFLVLAAKCKLHMVIAGDPMQLPPISTTNTPKHRDFLEKDVYTLVSDAKEMEDLFLWKDENPQITCFFDTQYRLNADLASVISDVFYDGRLKTGKIKRTIIEDESKLSVHVVDTSRYGAAIQVNKNDGGFRPVNEVHRSLVKELVRRLMLNEQVHPTEIGIIVPFRSVVWDYRKYLREEGFYDVEVGTIHTFQGREKHAIIFDSVMSGQGNGSYKRHFSVRPFDETKNGLSVPRLLNVAFSRAKEQLVILADMEHINQIYGNKFLGNLISRIRQMKAV